MDATVYSATAIYLLKYALGPVLTLAGLGGLIAYRKAIVGVVKPQPEASKFKRTADTAIVAIVVVVIVAVTSFGLFLMVTDYKEGAKKAPPRISAPAQSQDRDQDEDDG